MVADQGAAHPCERAAKEGGLDPAQFLGVRLLVETQVQAGDALLEGGVDRQRALPHLTRARVLSQGEVDLVCGERRRPQVAYATGHLHDHLVEEEAVRLDDEEGEVACVGVAQG